MMRTKKYSPMQMKAGDRVSMPLRTLIAEHKKLVKVLRSNDKAKQKAEARDQQKELAKYLKRR
jgi:hypothetical protein